MTLHCSTTQFDVASTDEAQITIGIEETHTIQGFTYAFMSALDVTDVWH